MLPCPLWLAVAAGFVPSPQVIGRVVERLREHFVPKDPITPPDVVFPYPGMRDFLEWSLYQGWLKLHLKYLHWYCAVALAPDVNIDAFIDPPIYIRTWYSPKVDLSTSPLGSVSCFVYLIGWSNCLVRTFVSLRGRWTRRLMVIPW